MDVTREMVQEAFRNKRAATAVLLAPRWLRDHPNDIRIILDYAEMLYKMTLYKQAILVYEDALGKVEHAESRWRSSINWGWKRGHSTYQI